MASISAVCGRPDKRKRKIWVGDWSVRSSVRPVCATRCCWPVWEFADWIQITRACSWHDGRSWFSGLVSSDCCAIPFFARLSFRQPLDRDAQRAAIGARLSSFLIITTQTILAILFASATTTSMVGFPMVKQVPQGRLLWLDQCRAS